MKRGRKAAQPPRPAGRWLPTPVNGPGQATRRIDHYGKNVLPEDFGTRPTACTGWCCAARRASQLAKPESRPLVPVRSKKPTIVALEEILEGKVAVGEAKTDEEDYFE